MTAPLVSFIAMSAFSDHQICEVVIGAGFLNILCSSKKENEDVKDLILDILYVELPSFTLRLYLIFFLDGERSIPCWSNKQQHNLFPIKLQAAVASRGHTSPRTTLLGNRLVKKQAGSEMDDLQQVTE